MNQEAQLCRATKKNLLRELTDWHDKKKNSLKAGLPQSIAWTWTILLCTNLCCIGKYILLFPHAIPIHICAHTQNIYFWSLLTDKTDCNAFFSCCFIAKKKMDLHHQCSQSTRCHHHSLSSQVWSVCVLQIVVGLSYLYCDNLDIIKWLFCAKPMQNFLNI